jgi:hypothetical protein
MNDDAGTSEMLRHQKDFEIPRSICIFITASTKLHVKCLLIIFQSLVLERLAIAFHLFPAVVPSMRGHIR